MFTELHIARISGQGPYLSENRPSSVAWGCLQCLNMTKEFYKLGFSAHTQMSHILNIHLCDNSVPKAKFDLLSKSLKELQTVVTGFKRRADTVLTKILKK